MRRIFAACLLGLLLCGNINLVAAQSAESSSSSFGTIAVNVIPPDITYHRAVLIDGIFSGQFIDAAQTVSIKAVPGKHSVTVIDEGESGSMDVMVIANTVTPVSIPLDEGEGGASAPGSAKITSLDTGKSLDNGIYVYGADKSKGVAVQYFDVLSRPIKAASIETSYLGNGDDPYWFDLLPYTKIDKNGSVMIDLQSALYATGLSQKEVEKMAPFSTEIAIEDENNVPYIASNSFDIGFYSIKGQLVAPPSNTTLPIGDFTLHFRKHYWGEGIRIENFDLKAVTDANGKFSLTGVPGGLYNITGSMKSGDMIYNVFGARMIEKNLILNVIPVAPKDMAANIVSIWANPESK